MSKQKLKNIFIFLAKGFIAYCVIFVFSFYYQIWKGKPFEPYVKGIFIPLEILANALLLQPHKKYFHWFNKISALWLKIRKKLVRTKN
ncbi:MAG: hypothetical protein IJC97_00185 [Oscillospiraceae bacterium]|nr:hypothetical protein [Oscillospiraceae bacterium]